MAKVYFVLGANIGDCLKAFEKAISLIENKIGQVEKKSSVYRSEPWGFDSQDWFYNQVIVVNTSKTPIDTLATLLEIEKDLGRQRHQSETYESRPIDIDIIYYDNFIISDESLQIPHPRMQDRLFVLKPLSEIAADFIHPVLRQTTQNLLKNCKDQSQVERYNECTISIHSC